MTSILTEVEMADELVKRAREQITAFNKGDWGLMRGSLASDARYEELGTERRVEGPDEIVELFKSWKTAFPDVVGAVTSALAGGNKAVLEVTWKGTHTGPLATAEGTIPASGNVTEIPTAVFYTFEGRKITACRQYFGSLTVLTQIGAQPR